MGTFTKSLCHWCWKKVILPTIFKLFFKLRFHKSILWIFGLKPVSHHDFFELLENNFLPFKYSVKLIANLSLLWAALYHFIEWNVIPLYLKLYLVEYIYTDFSSYCNSISTTPHPNHPLLTIIFKWYFKYIFQLRATMYRINHNIQNYVANVNLLFYFIDTMMLIITSKYISIIVKFYCDLIDRANNHKIFWLIIWRTMTLPCILSAYGASTSTALSLF